MNSSDTNSNNKSNSDTVNTQTGMIALFANHRVAANLMMFLFILSGLWGIKQLKTQFFPTFELDFVTITVVWTGASAEDIERSVTTPIEQELSSITEIKKLTSTSKQSTTTIVLELVEGTDIGSTLDKVKQRVETIRNLPSDAEKPVIQQVERFSPVANMLISGGQSVEELDYLAQQFEQELLQRGIRKINFVGRPQEEIAIEVSSSTLSDIGLSLNQVAELVRQNSQDLPAGTAGEDEVSKQIRSLSQQRDILGFENLPLLTDNQGRLLRVGDIANIERRPRDDEPLITWQGMPAIEIILMRTDAEDTLKTADILNDWLNDVKPRLPEGVVLKVYNERYQHLRDRIQLLLTNGAGGLILVVAILFLFLNVRVAFWVTMGIPVSFLATLALLHFFGGSINMISLFAMIMALGIIVDDAIVVGEDTLTHVEMGESAQSSAIGGAKRMLAPVMSSSLTTIAAFLPLTIVSGIMGKIMFDMPTVIICVIIASIVECFFILPGHLHHSLKKQKPENPASMRARFDRGFNHFKDNRLRPLVTLAITYRGTVVALGLSMLALCIALIASGYLRFTFFPAIDGSTIRASVEFTPGTSTATVDAFLIQAEEALKETEAHYGGNLVNAALTYHGRSFFDTSSGGKEIATERGSIIVDLVPGQRPASNAEFMATWQNKIAFPAGINQFKLAQRELGPGGPPIAYRLIGTDTQTLKDASIELQQALSKFEGLSNIEDDLPYGKEQLIYELTPAGRSLGLSIQSVGRQLRAAFDGSIVQIFHDHDKEIEVRVTLPANERETSRTLEYLPIITNDGRTVPLSNVVAFKSRQGIDQLNHTGGLLDVTVFADLDTNLTNANQIQSALEKDTFPQLKEKYGISIGLEGRAANQEDTLTDMKYGVGIGLTLIFIILAWVFASYSWPLAVMTAIPLGLTGAILGHFILGKDLSMFSLMGFFGLSGIVINDSIVLITFYAQLRAKGQAVHDAIVNAICARFRAVLLTSLTTIAGLLPILFETSTQAQFLIPMAISIVFGLGYGTFLILFFVPALLAYLENTQLRLGLKSRFGEASS